MKTRLAFLLILLAVLAPHPAPSEELAPLAPEEARRFIGQLRTVCGRVANTFHSFLSSGSPTFVNFGKPYPNHVFSIAIMGEDRKNFGNAPEKMFDGRDLCTTGLIEEYDGKPIMAVKDQSQVRWNN